MAGELLGLQALGRACVTEADGGPPPGRPTLMLRKCPRFVPGYGPVLPDLSP